MYLQISVDLIVVIYICGDPGPPKKTHLKCFDLIVSCLAALYGTLLGIHFGHFYA